MSGNKEIVHIPFSVLNELVVNKLSNTQEYTAGYFSYLKIFEHALTYAALGNKKKLIKHRLLWPIGLYSFWSACKRMVRPGGLSSPLLNEIVFIDPVRLNQDHEGKYYSIYIDKWIKLTQESNRTIIQRRKDDRVASDYSLCQFTRNHGLLDAKERMILRELKQVNHRALVGGNFDSDQLQHIGSALAIFWEDFRFYYRLFKKSKTRKLIFICHYHNEGLIAACKLLRIESIELQHGLIARNDLYYVYHQQFKDVMDKAIFPDKLLTYGAYWRNIVLEGSEFKPEQVLVAGDYLQRTIQEHSHKVEKQNVILVCSQKLMHNEYFLYFEKLAHHVSAYPEWRVIVKMHPLEPRKDLYQQVKQWGFDLVDMEQSLDQLLAITKIQISIYSTTFFDAIGFGVVNFSIQHLGSSSDYAADIVKEAVAFPIEVDENPITKYNQGIANLIPMQRTEVYAPFDEEWARQVVS